MKCFISGSEAIGIAGIKAGVKFYAGYPITPASGIYSFMMKNLPEAGGLAIGATDEISAISYCIGASMKGLKAITATSAPGFSLMIENLSYAVMTETPILVVLCQRLGPATGAATQSAQGDLLFSAFPNSGAYPVPVFSPSSIKDCFRTVIHAINVSEILRTPVILLTEKEITMTYETVDHDEIEITEIFARARFQGEKFKTYNFEKLWDIPPFSPIGGKYQVRVTGSAHDKEGSLKKDDPEVIEVLKHLESKIIDNIENYNLYEYYKGDGDILLISYGVSSKSALEAFETIKDKRSVGLLIMKLLYPVPLKFLKSIINNYKKIIVVEENLRGQYSILLSVSGLLNDKELIKINKIGNLISPSEILEILEKNG